GFVSGAAGATGAVGSAVCVIGAPGIACGARAGRGAGVAFGSAPPLIPRPVSPGPACGRAFRTGPPVGTPHPFGPQVPPTPPTRLGPVHRLLMHGKAPIVGSHLYAALYCLPFHTFRWPRGASSTFSKNSS